MTSLSQMGRAALTYVERFGWHVFPVTLGTKVPNPRFVRHGHLDATCDPEQVRRWWQADPTAPLAVACAASGLVVIDVDAYKPECEFTELEARLGPLPQTVRSLTPQGGVHYFFKDTVGHYVNPCPGAETKHKGYVLASPSVHPNGGTYKWDLGALPSETPIAELPDAWLAHLTRKAVSHNERPLRAVLPSSGIDAADSWLGHAFAAEGWLGGPLVGGKRAARCPWVQEHSDGRGAGNDSSTVIFPRASGHAMGGFRCAHGHCEGRTWTDVVFMVSPAAKQKADDAMRKARNRIALERLAAMRRAG